MSVDASSRDHSSSRTSLDRRGVATPAQELMPRVSPNGRLLAYSSNRSGRMEVYLRPIPGPGPEVPVSIGGGAEPV